MKKMIGWLGSLFARRATSSLDVQADNPETVDEEFKVELPSRAEVAASMKSHESAQDDHRATVPHIENLDSKLPDGGDSTVYDPYDKD